MLADVDIPTPNSVQIYKEKILNAPLTSDINYGPDTNTSLDDIFVDVVIQTEQAPMKFLNYMTRHEINDVYMKVPEHSIRLEEVKDLFYPNKDTKGKSPRTILALGRPGIGKTVLTRKIMRDWAKEVDWFYLDKIAFYFKFRWFHFEQLQIVTLKKFLQFTIDLSESEFEHIYAKILAKPQNAIFIFDGLDEFGGNLEKFRDFLDQSEKSLNKPTFPMPAMFHFIKIMSGQMLRGATVFVTSRPTANYVLSKLRFDRKVEIIGFTEEKIQKYVKKFLADHKKSELNSKVWSHIKSSELKNLCYIPVNCFIVCVTLLNCLNDQGSDNALPTTLTKLYQAALVYFHTNHNRIETKEQYENSIKDLQQLAFHGMKSDRMIFDDDNEFVNEQMKESGLLHCLPVPIYQIQVQVCFIHLTVQEFLAAKHIVETKEPKEIEDLISSHVNDGKWHLVLQFLAGLLGKKIEMFEEYRSCVLAFGEHFHPQIKVEDLDCVQQITKLLRHRCIETLEFYWCRIFPVQEALKHLLGAMATSECRINHEHCKLTHLNLAANHIYDDDISILTDFLENTQGVCLKNLVLSINEITSGGISKFCDVLDHESCNQLEVLKLDDNYGVGDEGVLMLCDGIRKGNGKLEVLNLSYSNLTHACTPDLSEFLKDEKCRLTDLSLSRNNIGDTGVGWLFDALRVKKCSLTKLDLSKCSLTKRCMGSLGEVLGGEQCQLTNLNLAVNYIVDEGVEVLCCALEKKQCKLTKLNLSSCSLTGKCIVSLCKVLMNCRLTELRLDNRLSYDSRIDVFLNKFTFEECRLLLEAEKSELCRARGLRIELDNDLSKF